MMPEVSLRELTDQESAAILSLSDLNPYTWRDIAMPNGRPPSALRLNTLSSSGNLILAELKLQLSDMPEVACSLRVDSDRLPHGDLSIMEMLLSSPNGNRLNFRIPGFSPWPFTFKIGHGRVHGDVLYQYGEWYSQDFRLSGSAPGYGYKDRRLSDARVQQVNHWLRSDSGLTEVFSAARFDPRKVTLAERMQRAHIALSRSEVALQKAQQEYLSLMAEFAAS